MKAPKATKALKARATKALTLLPLLALLALLLAVIPAWPCQASCAGPAGPGPQSAAAGPAGPGPRQKTALLKAEIAAEPGKSGGIYYAYPEPKGSELILPQPPEGYKPVYISHYGRHGSRWAINEKQYGIVIDFLRRQLDADNLTPLGIETLAKVEAISRHAQGHAGELAPLGERQHKAIARRMYLRTPSLFTDSARISAVSSIEPRCIVSMAAFCESLKEKNPALQITRTASPGDMSFISYSTPAARAFTSDTASWRAFHRAFRDSLLSHSPLLSLLLKKYPSPSEITASSASPSPASKAATSCSSPGSKAALSNPSPSGKAASSEAALKSGAASASEAALNSGAASASEAALNSGAASASEAALNSGAAGRCPAPCAGAAGPGPSPSLLLKSLHDIAVTTQNTGLDIDLLSLFTPDELFALWQAINYNMYVSHANYGAAEGMLSARSLLSEIITHADEDLAAREAACAPQVRLRFGHDTALIRLLALMGIDGCANREADPRAFCTAWQDFRISPMAANLQLIFYQKAEAGLASGEAAGHEAPKAPKAAGQKAPQIGEAAGRCPAPCAGAAGPGKRSKAAGPGKRSKPAGPGSGEPLILILLNERPASIPIPEAAPGFYSWSNLRSLWLPLLNP